MRKAVVDSGGEGKCRARGRVDERGEKSACVGIRGGIFGGKKGGGFVIAGDVDEMMRVRGGQVSKWRRHTWPSWDGSMVVWTKTVQIHYE